MDKTQCNSTARFHPGSNTGARECCPPYTRSFRTGLSHVLKRGILLARRNQQARAVTAAIDGGRAVGIEPDEAPCHRRAKTGD